MKIAYNGRFLSKSEPGGAMKVSRRVFEYMVRQDESNEFVLLTPYVHKKPDFLSRSNVEVKTGKIAGSPFEGGLFGVSWEQCVVPYLLARTKPDLYHTSMSGTVFTGRIPTVVTVHDLGYTNRDWFSGAFSRWYSFLVPRVVNRAEKVVAVSEFTKSELISKLGLSNKKVEVIYNGIDEVFLEESKASDAARTELPENYILFVGSINPRKNLTNTVRAFRKARKSYSLPHELLIAGGEKNIFAGTDISPGDDVRQLGYLKQSELKHLYSRAELTLFPSFYEGFGLPPLESMACGTPVITSNKSALPEIVGDAGVKVDPADVEMIADSIYNVLTDEGLRRDLIKRGKERVKNFSWERTARETLQLYEDIFNEK